jgi:hypothetical protein
MIINPYLFGAAYDPDAQAFITAAAITDVTQQGAINTLVLALKGYSIWTKFKAIYPIVGGTASQHKFNLKDPRDLDAAYRMTFATGWTHSSTGMLANSATFADTKLNLSTQTTLFNVHYSFYCRNNTDGGADIGVADSAIGYRNEGWAAARWGNFAQGGFYDNDAGMFGGGIKVANTDSTGMFISSAVAMNNQILRRNNTTLGTWTALGVGSAPANTTIYLGAVHLVSPDSAVVNTNHQYAFASIGDGLTDAEALSFYNAVQTYQTTLGRNV